MSVCGSADKADDMGDWRVLAAAAVCVVLLSGCVVRGLNECGGNARAAGRDGRRAAAPTGARRRNVCVRFAGVEEGSGVGRTKIATALFDVW